MRTSSTNMRHERAFTVMELIVVIMLIGLILGMTYGGIEMLVPGSRLDRAANRLASQIEEVRHEAIVRGWDVKIQYDLDGARYRAWAEPPPSKAKTQLADQDGRIHLVGDDSLQDGTRWMHFESGIEMKALIRLDAEPQTLGQAIMKVKPDGQIETHAMQIYSDELRLWRTVVVSGIQSEAEVVESQVGLPVIEENDF